MSKRQKPTRKEFGSRSLRKQVRDAMPTAYMLIEQGIDYGQRMDDSFLINVADFMDDADLRRFYKNATDEDMAAWANRLEAARAIGIALGLMLRPEPFTGGVQ